MPSPNRGDKMPKQIRPIRVCGDVAYITLTQGRTAIIDAADIHLVDAWCWSAFSQTHTEYARRSGGIGTKKRTVLLHRELMGEPDGLQIDHRDGDGLNNRRSNLRVATRSQNMHNRSAYCNNKSGFKGVDFRKEGGKWRAKIRINNKEKHLGMFDSPEEAHEAYCRASEKYHGEFGRTE